MATAAEAFTSLVEALEFGMGQDAAVAHWFAVVDSERAKSMSWAVVRHEVDYKRPALLGDELVARTWVGEVTAATCERFCEVVRPADGLVLARSRTTWCVFDPATGDIRSGGTDSIAAWFIDTNYNEEGFFVRHAYFLGAQDPYKSLKVALRAEVDEDAWATLYRDTSRPFPRPDTGRIAVKVINHFGDEVMKVFGI